MPCTPPPPPPRPLTMVVAVPMAVALAVVEMMQVYDAALASALTAVLLLAAVLSPQSSRRSALAAVLSPQCSRRKPLLAAVLSPLAAVLSPQCSRRSPLRAAVLLPQSSRGWRWVRSPGWSIVVEFLFGQNVSFMCSLPRRRRRRCRRRYLSHVTYVVCLKPCVCMESSTRITDRSIALPSPGWSRVRCTWTIRLRAPLHAGRLVSPTPPQNFTPPRRISSGVTVARSFRDDDPRLCDVCMFRRVSSPLFISPRWVVLLHINSLPRSSHVRCSACGR